MVNTIQIIASHLEQLGYRDFKLVSDCVLQIGDGAITYDPIWGYCATRNDLRIILRSYLCLYLTEN